MHFLDQFINKCTRKEKIYSKLKKNEVQEDRKLSTPTNNNLISNMPVKNANQPEKMSEEIQDMEIDKKHIHERLILKGILQKKRIRGSQQNIEKEKNRELEGQFYQLQEKLKEQTSTNKVKNVFEIVQEYDKLIQMHANKTNKDTLSIIHKKSYEGLKGVLIDYFVHNNNLHKHQYSMVVEKIKIFEGAYNTLKADSDAKKEEAQIKQRELKNKIYALEFRAKESADELTKTKALLESFKKASQQNQNQNSSIPLSPRYALKRIFKSKLFNKIILFNTINKHHNKIQTKYTYSHHQQKPQRQH